MECGIDVLLKGKTLRKAIAIGLVTNQVALTTDGIPSRLAMLKAKMPLVRLFSPEHGLSATGADGFRQDDGIDELTGLPVISLYGEKLAPRPADLAGLDVILFDIPDVGCRFYTYLWTMTHVMESCVAAKIPFVVLDRPNPTGLNLRLSEGPFLDEQLCSSFIGRWKIPLRHCCTLGELARYFQATRMPGLQLEVITVQGYQRTDIVTLQDPFAPTSPAIRDLAAALCYPGTGLAEGVNLQEGRETPFSFRTMAAPWLNTELLLSELEKERLPGIHFLKCRFTANGPPYAGSVCEGLEWVVTDTQQFRPVHTGWTLLQMIHRTHPGKLEPRAYPTVANPTGLGHLDRLTGVPAAFDLISLEKDLPLSIDAEWEDQIKPFLLY